MYEMLIYGSISICAAIGLLHVYIMHVHVYMVSYLVSYIVYVHVHYIHAFVQIHVYIMHVHVHVCI